MKKMIPIFLLVVALAGCSALPDITQLLATPTPAQATETATPPPTVTQISTFDLFAISTSTPVTYTPTETPLIPNAAPTTTGTPRPTFSAPLNDVNSNYYFTKNEGFLAVLISGNILYWNEGPCMPRDVKISAFVEYSQDIDKVLLFMRLREKQNTLNVTKWGAGAEMIPADNGSYNYDVRTFNLNRFYFYKDAWLEYQIVSITKDFEVVGRTQIYDRSVSLQKCNLVK